ncbi:MAG: NAD(P)/FAD-dependent oxidoreductase [Tannerellaceae bacterium]|jgi:all-trans-retinol 13,14-reductase|nr:NAD(P)/FAD-dependent oxidoreductase [Tannerellaceae bacterium]
MDKTVIIFGGGLGGLCCGAFLAKEGYRVRIFEKHYALGGGLHEFKREGVSFETGMHVVGALSPGDVLHRIFSYLGVMPHIRILPAGDSCFELVRIASDGKEYRMHRGGEAFAAALGEEFPKERESIRQYMRALYRICDEVKLYNLEKTDASFREYSGMFTTSVGEFIDSFVCHPRLRSALGFCNPLYAGSRYRTPVYIHALISKLYIEGAAQMVGGSRQLADALVGVIRENGGEVYAGNGIRHVEISGKAIAWVETADGVQHRADTYISSLHPSALFRLLDVSRLQRSYRERLEAIPNTYSAFTTYIVFKPETFPFFNHTFYYQDDYSDTWEHDVYTEASWPRGLMFVTPATTYGDVYARKMIVNCIMNYDTVRPWEDTFTGHRGEGYASFKQRCEQRVLDKLQEIFPQIRSCIRSVYSATPLTLRDFSGQKEGALYGVRKDCRQMERSHIPVRTKLGNLLLTGQNIKLHGILGVPLTAILTCGELLGVNYLLDKINGHNRIIHP